MYSNCSNRGIHSKSSDTLEAMYQKSERTVKTQNENSKKLETKEELKQECSGSNLFLCNDGYNNQESEQKSEGSIPRKSAYGENKCHRTPFYR